MDSDFSLNMRLVYTVGPPTRKKTIDSSLHNTKRTRRVWDADQLDISRSPVGFHGFFLLIF